MEVMADIETLRLFVNERLSAVAEDILAVLVRTIVQYQQHYELLQRPGTIIHIVHYQNHSAVPATLWAVLQVIVRLG